MNPRLNKEQSAKNKVSKKRFAKVKADSKTAGPYRRGQGESYGSPGNYAAKVSESVDRLVRDRWLTESDGRKIKADVVVPQTFSR